MQYLRTAIDLPNTNVLGLMPAYYDRGYFWAKVISVYHTSGGTGYPSHQVEILLFGKEYWNRVLNFDELAAEGVINPEDVNLLTWVETADEAWAEIVRFYDLDCS